jgi:SAM-dependent methyltransferase
MNNILLALSHIFKEFGFAPKKFYRALKGVKPIVRNYFKIKDQISKSDSSFKIEKILPSLTDRFENAGSLPGHYFYLDLVVARKIFKDNPDKHVDVGSRIDGFAAHLASFRELEIFDIRDFKQTIPNIKFIRADLTSDNFDYKEYCDSLSSLHALEHFGLGRYGDRVDINGHLKGFENFYKMLKPGGKFYFAVPIGKQRIEFDSHRVFSIRYLLKMFSGKFNVHFFSYIDDNNNLFENVPLTKDNVENNFNCHYGCGIFELIKIT